MRNTLEVLLRHPFISVSLGGISSDIAASFLGRKPVNNIEVKKYEGSMVILEVLVGLGVIGCFLIGFIFISSTLFILKNYKRKGLSGKLWILAFLTGFILETFLLMFNQNLLRVYYWNHIALLFPVCLYSENSQGEIINDIISKKGVLPSFLAGILLATLAVFIFLIVGNVSKGNIKLLGAEIKISEKDIKIKDGGVVFYNVGRGLYGYEDIVPLYITNNILYFSLESKYNISETYFNLSEARILRERFSKFFNYNDFSILIKDKLSSMGKDVFESDERFLNSINKLLEENEFWKGLSKKMVRYSKRNKIEMEKSKNKINNVRLNRLLLEDMLPWIPRNPYSHNFGFFLFQFSVNNDSQKYKLPEKFIAANNINWITTRGTFNIKNTLIAHLYSGNVYRINTSSGNIIFTIKSNILKPYFIVITFLMFITGFVVSFLFTNRKTK
ncbi:MAG: hypothetical protein ACP5QT_05330 [Brevinematia bacterium]